MERDGERNQMITFLSVASREFEKDLNAVELVMNQLEKKTHSENVNRDSNQDNIVDHQLLRSGLKPARTSSEKSCGSSQAAKWPPRSTSLKYARLG
jgi:hypothetical protein